MNEWNCLVCFFPFIANKLNLFVGFLGESTMCKTAFGFIWPLQEPEFVKWNQLLAQVLSSGITGQGSGDKVCPKSQ